MKLVKLYIVKLSNAHENLGNTEFTVAYPLSNCNLMIRKRLFATTVPANKNLFAGTPS